MKSKYLDPKNGLSMTDAKSISNLASQRVSEIKNKLNKVNNFSSSFTYGPNFEKITKQNAHPMPSDVKELLSECGKLTTLQAIIMEGLKEKEEILSSIENTSYVEVIDSPDYELSLVYENIPQVDEDWAFSELPSSERYEYLEMQARCSEIGKFFHKGGHLDRLRRELNDAEPFETVSLKKDELIPVNRVFHHTSDYLMELHEELAREHREYEKRLNYFKAKVKNMVSDENIRISEENAKGIQEVIEKNAEISARNEELRREYMALHKKNVASAQAKKSALKKEASALKITVPSFLKSVVAELKGEESTEK